MIDRRLLLTALACLPGANLLAQQQSPRQRISAAQLHEALSARFPVRLLVGGLLALQVSAPRLLLLPSRNQLGATLVVQLASLQLQPIPPGEVDVVFSLRYEPAGRAVRGHGLDILELRWPGLQPEFLQAVRAQLRAAARDAIGEVVLHEFTQRELALTDAMGFEPREFTVMDDGVVVTFGPKTR